MNESTRRRGLFAPVGALVSLLVAGVAAVVVVAAPFGPGSGPTAAGRGTGTASPAEPVPAESAGTLRTSAAAPPVRKVERKALAAPEPPKPRLRGPGATQSVATAVPVSRYPVLGTKCLAPGIRAKDDAGSWLTCSRSADGALRWSS